MSSDEQSRLLDKEYFDLFFGNKRWDKYKEEKKPVEDLNHEALWDISVKEAKAEAEACYGPNDSKEKRIFQERLITKYYNQRAFP